MRRFGERSGRPRAASCSARASAVSGTAGTTTAYPGPTPWLRLLLPNGAGRRRGDGLVAPYQPAPRHTHPAAPFAAGRRRGDGLVAPLPNGAAPHTHGR